MAEVQENEQDQDVNDLDVVFEIHNNASVAHKQVNITSIFYINQKTRETNI